MAFASPTGTLSSPSELSLADGSAQVRGTLGTVAGTDNTFTATALGLTNSPITFPPRLPRLPQPPSFT